MSVTAKVIWTFSSYVIVRCYYLCRLIFLQWNDGAVVFHLPNLLGALYPLLFALMERINVVNFPKRQIIRKSFRKYFSIYIYTWVSPMFQEFMIQKTKRQKHKVSLIQKKIGNFTTLPSYPFVPQQPGVRQKCIYVSNQGRFPAFKALLAYFHNSSNLGSGGTRHL